uniref:BTB (POZ) domain containing 16 n=1 Tax=Oncorhynchus kisutch TaxID=8019 RepID=A0A8C7IW04_ONCKI
MQLCLSLSWELSAYVTSTTTTKAKTCLAQCVVCLLSDVVLECLGSQWELHCPNLTKSGTLSNLYMSTRQQRARSLQDRAETYKPSKDHITVNTTVKSTKTLHYCYHSIHYSMFSCGCIVNKAEVYYEVTDNMSVIDRCLTEMINKISSSTVCIFHRVSCKFKETSLQRACERWLELYLVTELTCFIYLRDLPFELLHKTLSSPRVFAACEYQLLKTVLYWVFLQFNPAAQILPSHRFIMTFFSSWPRAGVFLEQPVGQRFTVLFRALRLHGITQRELRHWDPAMSVRACERHPFSMMTERALSYQINVQAHVHGQWQEFNSGPINQEFGLTKRTCKSQVWKVEDGLILPIFVTFALAFAAV